MTPPSPWMSSSMTAQVLRSTSSCIDKGELPFTNGDYIFIPKIADAVKNKATSMKAYVVNKDMKEFELKMDELTDDEREIILDGCLINYYRNH